MKIKSAILATNMKFQFLKNTLKVFEYKSEMQSSTSVVAESACAICLLPICKLSQEATIDSCIHKFHFHCIQRWSNMQNTCPTCRSRFTSIKFKILDRNQSNEMYYPYADELCQICNGV